jgi:hypothetical protein
MENWHYVAIAVVVILLLVFLTRSEHAQDCGYKPREDASLWEKTKHWSCMNQILSYTECNCNRMPYRIAHAKECAENLKAAPLKTAPELCVSPGIWGSVCDHLEFVRCQSGLGGEKHICSALIPEEYEYMGNFNCKTSWCGCKPMDDAPKFQKDAFRTCVEKQCGGKPAPGSSVKEWSKFNNCVNNGGRRDML